MGTSSCLVVTTRGAGKRLRSFAAHHLRIGVDHIFLYFDDPADATQACVAGIPNVTVIPVDDEVRRAWALSPLFPALESQVKSEVMARQMLNAMDAMARARALGIDWLIHLDDDELLDCARPLDEILSLVQSGIGASQIVFDNSEALPERMDIDDCFKEVTLFKTNPWRLTKRQGSMYAKLTGRREYFLAYANGKAGVRIANETIVPDGAHRFKTTGTPLRTLKIGPVARVLHYAHCGLASYEAKYRYRRETTDYYFGKQKNDHPFQIASRHLALARDDAALRRTYVDNVMLDDAAIIGQLMAAGVLFRYTKPADALRGACGAMEGQADGD